MGIMKSEDKGATWRNIAYPNMDFHYMASSMADSDVLYAWSTTDFLIVSLDGGKTWKESKPFEEIYSLAADRQEAGKVYVGSGRSLYVSEDFGSTWKEVASFSEPVVAIADGQDLMIATAEKVFISRNDGETWSEAIRPEDSPVRFLIAGSNDIFAISGRSDIFRYNDESWKKMEG